MASSDQALTETQRRVLVALVQGYHARAGMKDRLRALNEWEIARRADGTALSYAEFSHDSARDALMTVLSDLQRLGLVSTWERGVNYDTFVPTPTGASVVGVSDKSAAFETDAATAADSHAADDSVIERLDEMIGLLRSIDRRLSRPD